jgi:predicted CoA-binding protein
MAHPKVVEDEARIAEIVRTSRTVAVVGMKDEREPTVPAFQVPHQLAAGGYQIFPVNPKLTGTALGQRVYPNLAALGRAVDIVDVFRRSDAVPQVADDVLALPADKRPKVVWLQSGVVNEQAAERLAEAGIEVVMDRCLAVYAAMHHRS